MLDRLSKAAALSIGLPLACALLARCVVAIWPGCVADLDMGVYDCRVGQSNFGFPLAVLIESASIATFIFIVLAALFTPLVVGGVAGWRMLRRFLSDRD
ncbi:hypothetical protein [Rudaea sp.]|nr:hypothetical protein [Rudaea sp.]